MKNIKVSVIIPVYNAGVFLKECLDSVINQTLKEIEIIIINDGSTDSSYSIIKEYTSIDSRIVVVNQKNQGQAVARNNAIEVCKGEFISFVDSDDRIKLNSLEKLYSEAKNNNLDILEGRFQFFRKNNINKAIQPEHFVLTDNVTTGLNYIQNYRKTISTSICDKLWKTTFIKDNKIKNGLQMAGAEDVKFSVDAFLVAKRVKNINLSFYLYRNNPNSTTSQVGEKHIKGRLNMLNYLGNKAAYNDRKYKDFLKNDILLHLIYTLRVIKNYSTKNKFREECLVYLDFFVKKYRRDILHSGSYKWKEKLLLLISIHFYLFYYDVKRKLIYIFLPEN